MRLIGHVEGREAAAVFSGYLLLQGIENDVELDSGDRFAVWVHSDDQLEAAAGHLARFKREPDHQDFRGSAEAADRLRQRETAEAEAAAARTYGRRQIWRERPVVLTWLLILACVVVFILTGMGEKEEVVRHLAIADFWVEGSYVHWAAGLSEVRAGQIWRLVSPIFLHFGLIHILFNMLWLKDLGGMIEQRLGAGFLAVFVVVVAATSNLGQYLVGGAPNFGGMSGVVYGLLGYVWMKGKYDSASGLALHHTTVAMMLIWFVLCLTGLMGNIANTAHGVGLGMGVAWGYLSARRSRHFTG